MCLSKELLVSITNMFLMWMTVIGVGVSRASNTVHETDLASTHQRLDGRSIKMRPHADAIGPRS